MQEHPLLGHRVKDIVTGFIGVVESVSFDLYGCLIAVVRPEVDKKKPGEGQDPHWFDLKRLVQISKSPVMPVPTFETAPGPAEKPTPR